MTPMAPTRPTPSPTVPASPRVCRVRLAAGLAAAKAARAVVETTIRAWRVPVDPDVAVLLTSELVTNAVTHGTEEAGSAGGFVTLAIACGAAGLRVDVHDGSGDLPLLENPPEAEAETGRGLLLVTSLSAEWGFYRTPKGKAVYFTLEFLPDVHETVSDGPDDGGSRSVS
jgi:anti-sigma regulatory factor (Ser/Thr protein kinase)